MGRLRRLIGAVGGAGVLGAVLLMAGCTTGSVPRELKEVAIPSGGNGIPAEVWEAVDKAPEGQPLIAQGSTVWPLPLVARKEWFGVPPGHREAEKANYSEIGLGVPYEALPLQYSFTKYRYAKGVGEPVGMVIRRKNPFWSWAKVVGDPGPDTEARAGGVPLLFDWSSEKGYAWYFDEMVNDRAVYRTQDMWQSLWSLGPARVQATDRMQIREVGNWQSDADYVFPLQLGGVLGMLLWSHYEVDSSEPGEVSNVKGYGPLLGWPSYRYAEVKEFDRNVSVADGQFKKVEKLRTVLGGLLWWGHSRDEEGKRVTAVNGPLWGLFGAGTHKGNPAIYLLRIPVKTGDAEKE